MDSLPLHPGIVHIPIGLALVLPLIVGLAILLINKYKIHKPIWFIVIALQLVLTASAFLSMKTGENEEDLVEQVVEKSIIHEHEEKAEAFTYASVFILLVSSSLLFVNKSKLASSIRYSVLALHIVLMILAYNVGHAGGELVYKYNASDAYKGEQK